MTEPTPPTEFDDTTTDRSTRSANSIIEDFPEFLVDDITLDRLGRQEIKVVSSLSDILLCIRRKFTKKCSLEGHHFACCLHLNAHTALFLETLIQCKCKVAVVAASQLTVQNHVAAAMASAGIRVYGSTAMTTSQLHACYELVCSWEPTFILDEFGEFLQYFYRNHMDRLRHLKIVYTLSSSAFHFLNRIQGSQGYFAVPIVNINSVEAFRLAQVNDTLTATAVIIKMCGFVLPGSEVCINGFDEVGCELARQFSRTGAHITVVETDPRYVLNAVFNGYTVGQFHTLSKKADIILFTEPVLTPMTSKIFKHLKNGCLVVNVSNYSLCSCLPSLKHINCNWLDLQPNIQAIVDRSSSSTRRVFTVNKGRPCLHLFHNVSFRTETIKFGIISSCILENFSSNPKFGLSFAHLHPGGVQNQGGEIMNVSPSAELLFCSLVVEGLGVRMDHDKQRLIYNQSYQ
ncbi:hypothetical protein PCE1_000539 [Barthelona sp. PCE]